MEKINFKEKQIETNKTKIKIKVITRIHNNHPIKTNHRNPFIRLIVSIKTMKNLHLEAQILNHINFNLQIDQL